MNVDGLDYAEIIQRTLADPLALDIARELWRKVAPDLLDARPREGRFVRVSDSGACSLALWADLHDKLDVPENLKTLDSKMQPGAIDGARTACLVSAGIRRWFQPLTTVAEKEVNYNFGIVGHADLIVYAEPDPLEVIECKMTLFGKGIEPPEQSHRFWLYQACLYALAAGAPSFVVLVHAPAAWGGPQRKCFRYATADYTDETYDEFERLLRATRDDPPEADAREAWRCKTCRYSQCERNENPLLPTTNRIVDELVL